MLKGGTDMETKMNRVQIKVVYKPPCYFTACLPERYLSNPTVDIKWLQWLSNLESLVRKLQDKWSVISTDDWKRKEKEKDKPVPHLYVVLLQIEGTEIGPSNNILQKIHSSCWKYEGPKIRMLSFCIYSTCNTYILLCFYWFDEAVLRESKVLQTWCRNGKNKIDFQDVNQIYGHTQPTMLFEFILLYIEIQIKALFTRLYR